MSTNLAQLPWSVRTFTPKFTKILISNNQNAKISVSKEEVTNRAKAAIQKNLEQFVASA